MDLRSRITRSLDGHPELTVRSLSLKAGLSDSWLHKLLKGDVRSPTIENIEKLAEALDVDPRWLAFGEGGPEVYSDVGNVLARMTDTQKVLAMQMLEVLARTGTDG